MQIVQNAQIDEEEYSDRVINKGKGIFLDYDDNPADLYRWLIIDSYALFVDIENEIVIMHNFIRDKYRLRFPELESFVSHPIDYAQVVKKIGNEMDVNRVDLKGLMLIEANISHHGCLCYDISY